MSTLLLRLAAPLQSWGIDAKFDRRGTERLPTKSGVIGLLAAALGRKRNDPIDDLRSLTFGVRVEQEGVLVRDFHTARNSEDAYVTQRYYLSDAIFLVGLHGDSDLLTSLEWALGNPVFPLFLGRRSCPPAGQVCLGVRKGMSLLDALRNEPWQAGERAKTNRPLEVRLRIVTDASSSDGTAAYLQRDVPLSFAQAHRRFGFRRVTEAPLHLIETSESHVPIRAHRTSHDAMSEL